MDYDQLYHHGIKGMKWGVRRFQKKDGSLTSAGRKRYGDGPDHDSDSESRSGKPRSTRKKSVSEMTDEELAAAIKRAEMEKRYNDLNPKTISTGEKFIQNVIGPSINQAAKTVLTDALIKQGKKYLGLDSKDDSFDKLKKEVEKLNLEKQYKNLKDDYNNNLQNEIRTRTLEKQAEKLRSEDNSPEKEKKKEED